MPWKTAKALAQKIELFSVISSQVENITRWRETDLKILEVDTYRISRDSFSTHYD